jgi:hypothetical protein
VGLFLVSILLLPVVLGVGLVYSRLTTVVAVALVAIGQMPVLLVAGLLPRILCFFWAMFMR